MKLVNCGKQLSVGVQQLDEQQCKLVDIINQLHESLKEGHGFQAIQQTLQQLHEYTETHFQHEEQLLEEHQYPQLEEHRVAHQQLSQQLAQFQLEMKAAPHITRHHLLQFLLDWLIGHIKSEDRAYGSFLNSRGVY